MSRKLIICTDFHVSLFGLQLIKLFEKGFIQISVCDDMNPSSYLNDDDHYYLFAYSGKVPSGITDIVITSMDAFAFNISLFCNKEESDKLQACSGGSISPRFESELDILSSFNKALDRMSK